MEQHEAAALAGAARDQNHELAAAAAVQASVETATQGEPWIGRRHDPGAPLPVRVAGKVNSYFCHRNEIPVCDRVTIRCQRYPERDRITETECDIYPAAVLFPGMQPLFSTT